MKYDLRLVTTILSEAWALERDMSIPPLNNSVCVLGNGEEKLHGWLEYSLQISRLLDSRTDSFIPLFNTSVGLTAIFC